MVKMAKYGQIWPNMVKVVILVKSLYVFEWPPEDIPGRAPGRGPK